MPETNALPASVPPLFEALKIEMRSIVISDDVPRGFTGFAGVRQVFRLDRQVISKQTGEIRSETVYGMTSLARAWCYP